MTNAVIMSEEPGVARSASRVAGAAYLFMVGAGILWWLLIGSKLAGAGSPAGTASRIVANESLFRVGVVVELAMALNLVALALSHAALLRRAGPHLAALGQALVVAVAILDAVMVLLAFVAFHLLKRATADGGAPQIVELVGRWFDVRMAGHTISTALLHAGMLVFYVQLWRARLVPRGLAAFGLVAYSLSFGAIVLGIVVPGSPVNLMALQRTVDAVCISPSIVIELVAGVWLLAKGAAVTR